jgi:hypothetical protein
MEVIRQDEHAQRMDDVKVGEVQHDEEAKPFESRAVEGECVESYPGQIIPDAHHDIKESDPIENLATRTSSRPWKPTSRYLESMTYLAAAESIKDVHDKGSLMETLEEDEGMDGNYQSSGGESSETVVPVGVSKKLIPPGLLAEPNSYREAMHSESASEWTKATQSERDSLQRNETWELVPLPRGRKAIKNKWVYKIKYDSEGKVERFKARMVVKGFSQVEGIDYHETFAPVARMSSIRLLLAIAAQLDLDIHQLDVNTAFLYGELQEEIYMEQPEGMEDLEHPDWVCRLKKGLYFLKQSPRVWNEELDCCMKPMGLSQCKADNCIYWKRQDHSIVLVAIYVDDIIIADNDPGLRQQIRDDLLRRYEMKDLGELHWVLGMRITRDRSKGTIRVDQERYLGDILKRFGMEGSAPVETPMATGCQLSKEMEPSTAEEIEYMKGVPYRSAIGSLMYAATGTRPDLAFAVGRAARYCANPGLPHWVAVKRILRYVKRTLNYGLTFTKGFCGNGINGLTFEGYSDADWAGDLDKRRSTTGYIFQMAGGPVSWSSQLQATTALSTVEAEYMAICSTAQEALWLQHLLHELGFETPATTVHLHGDNMGSISLAKNLNRRRSTKHIEIRHFFVQDIIQRGALKLERLSTNKMVADILTNALPRDRFCELRDQAHGELLRPYAWDPLEAVLR